MPGKETRMVIEGGESQRSAGKPDPTLIKILARAHHLNERLMTSGGASISEIARCEGVNRTYISRLLRLAFLSPEITRAIVHGRQPADFSAAKLLRATRLPLDWQAQKAALGFDTT